MSTPRIRRERVADWTDSLRPRPTARSRAPACHRVRFAKKLIDLQSNLLGDKLVAAWIEMPVGVGVFEIRTAEVEVVDVSRVRIAHGGCQIDVLPASRIGRLLHELPPMRWRPVKVVASRQVNQQ